MRYTIEGFSQAFAMTLKKDVETNGKITTRKIDCTDLVILRWFVDFYPNMKKVEVEGKQYAWLTHKKLLEDLPIVDITKRAFIDRMQKLVEFEILEYKLVKEGGTFSLYGFGKNYANMIQTKGGMQSNDTGVCSQENNKDNSIKDASIKNSSNRKRKKKEVSFVPPTLEEVEAYCRENNISVNPKKFFDYFDVGDWHDSNGKKVLNWKQKLITWEGHSTTSKGNTGGEIVTINGKEFEKRNGKFYIPNGNGVPVNPYEKTDLF